MLSNFQIILIVSGVGVVLLFTYIIAIILVKKYETKKKLLEKEETLRCNEEQKHLELEKRIEEQKLLKQRRDLEVNSLNKSEYSKLNKFIETMSKIIDSKSFEISFDSKDPQNKLQLIEFDINLVIPKQESYENFNEIYEEYSSYIFEFATFLIKENYQFPIFKFGEKEALVAFVKKDDKEKIEIFHVTELHYFRESSILEMINISNLENLKI